MVLNNNKCTPVGVNLGSKHIHCGAWRGMAAVVDGDDDDDFVEMMVWVAIMKCSVVYRGGCGRSWSEAASKNV
nr:hypothetical protein [Tanacetum cinerariifolium]